MLIEHSYFLNTIVFALLFGGYISAQASEERVLYRKPLSDRQELFVVQGPLLPITALRGFLPSEVADHSSGCFSLNAEVRTAGESPLRLWSKLCPLGRALRHDDLKVLDVLVLPGRLLVVTAEANFSISVRQMGLCGYPDRSTGLQPGKWSMVAVTTPDEQLSAKVVYNEKEKRVEVEVTQCFQGTRQHTLFEQKGTEWDFVRVKQWQEKVPLTDPAEPPRRDRGK